MKHLDEYRDPTRARRWAAEVGRLAGDGEYTFMEVCGTHTMSIARNGLRGLLPKNVRLISGPGCPVCVTPKEYVDAAVALAGRPDLTVATFGDMLRVPGSEGDLAAARAAGADVRVVYSPREALALARSCQTRTVAFLGVGFETTAPAVAATVLAAERDGVDNFVVLTAHKLVPPALAALCQRPDLRLDGFLCPPHVSAIIGTKAYAFLPAVYGKPCAVAAFEPVDILYGLALLLRQVREGRPTVANGYTRVVKEEGNRRAQAIMQEVFETADARWRGLGYIPASGLRLTAPYRRFDAQEAFSLSWADAAEDPGCRCGEVLTGLISPPACPLFSRRCTPATPVGPCMVSSEGTCAAAYRYGYD